MRKQLKKLWMCLNPVYKKTVYQEELLQDIKAALEKLSSEIFAGKPGYVYCYLHE